MRAALEQLAGRILSGLVVCAPVLLYAFDIIK